MRSANLYRYGNTFDQPDNTGMTTVSIIHIPFWVYNVFQRNNLPLKTIYNVEEMRRYLSLNDIAQMMALNNEQGYVLNLWQDLDNIYRHGFSIHRQSINIPGVKDKELEDWTNTAYLLKEKQTDELKERLIATKADNVYVVKEIMPQCIAIIHNGMSDNPGKATIDAFRVYVEILKLLYVHMPRDAVSRTSVYRKYLSVLAKTVNLP